MSNPPLTKAQNREVRRLAGEAHERELSSAAELLYNEFERWKRGEIDVFTLNEEIHKFHDGISRDLYKQYAMGKVDWSLASAIGRDIIKESEVEPGVVQKLKNAIELARQWNNEKEA